MAKHVPLLVPGPIRLLTSGGVAIVAVIALATALRSPLDEAQALAASFDERGDGSASHPAGEAAATAPRPSASPIAGDVATGRIAPEPSPARRGDERPPAPGAFTPPLAAGVTASSNTELRDKLTRDIQTGNHKAAVTDIDALMTNDPTAPEDRELRNTIVELAMRIMVGAGPEGDQLFTVITDKMGTRGDDILYELVTTRGGSRAARRADELLKDPKIFTRGTAAMRVAYELRVAPCDFKSRLFDRARADGDGRTLGQLQLLNNECGRWRSSTCCLKKDPKLKETIAAMKERLGQ